VAVSGFSTSAPEASHSATLDPAIISPTRGIRYMVAVLNSSVEDCDAVRKARILILEQERATVGELRSHLTPMGHEIVGVADSPEHVIELADELRPDPVLMDLCPSAGMDGAEAARAIRKRFNIPVVYVTAYSNRDVVERAVVSAPFGYVLKPFSAAELRVAIEVALFRHFLEAQALKQKRLLELILGTVTEGLVATDGNMRVTYFNREAERLTGRTARSAVGKPLTEVFPVVANEACLEEESALPLGREILKSSHSVCAVTLIARDQRRVPIELSVSALRDETGTLLGGVFAFWAMAREDLYPSVNGML
jgi:PAS domain S-box-containing protein